MESTKSSGVKILPQSSPSKQKREEIEREEKQAVLEKLTQLKQLETKEKENKAEMEEYSVKIQNEIDEYIQKLDELLKSGGPLEAFLEINQELNEKHLVEIQKQANANTEVWKYEKINKTAQDESTKFDEIIQRASQIIRETQKSQQEIKEATTKMQEEQRLWRKEKEVEFEKSTQDLSSKINQTANDDSNEEN